MQSESVSILVITFTKAAATEMKERYESSVRRGPRHLSVSAHFMPIFPNLKICIQV